MDPGPRAQGESGHIQKPKQSSSCPARLATPSLPLHNFNHLTVEFDHNISGLIYIVDPDPYHRTNSNNAWGCFFTLDTIITPFNRQPLVDSLFFPPSAYLQATSLLHYPFFPHTTTELFLG